MFTDLAEFSRFCILKFTASYCRLQKYLIPCNAIILIFSKVALSMYLVPSTFDLGQSALIPFRVLQALKRVYTVHSTPQRNGCPGIQKVYLPFRKVPRYLHSQLVLDGFKLMT
jgi:hypothetical protein